jgi:cell division septation protein DedD
MNSLRGILALLVVSAVVSSPLQGQSPGRTPAADAAFRRAITLVNDGEGAAGRALLDSMVNAARPGSLELAEALYWRATVALSAVEAEQDYRRVILDHPLSPRIPDALLRLAQLELARADRENALRRLQRLDIEYPGYPGRARTSYWMARAYLDQNDVARGCAAVTEARGRAAPNDVELRNQIDFLALRCPTAAPPAIAGAEQPAAPAAGAVSEVAPPTLAASPPAAGSEAATSGTPPPAAPERAAPTAPPPAPTAPPTTPPPAREEASSFWSVQVAAYNTRPPANALAERLRTRGYQARVDGTAAPFRVRIGEYPGRTAAVAALQEIKGRGMDGFVVQVDVR